jgi:hypothetical protein
MASVMLTAVAIKKWLNFMDGSPKKLYYLKALAFRG